MKRILIVGGGFGGLALSYYLSKKSKYQIDLIEKEDTLEGWHQDLNLKAHT